MQTEYPGELMVRFFWLGPTSKQPSNRPKHLSNCPKHPNNTL